MTERYTLFTDAGYCPTHKVASYAVWIKHHTKTERFYGQLKGEFHSAGVAELCALANGFYFLQKHFGLQSGDYVYATTDSEEALNWLEGRIKSTNYKTAKDAAKKSINNITAKFKLRVDFRRVKGHSSKKDARSAVNTWCDKHATIALKAARKAKLEALVENSANIVSLGREHDIRSHG